MVPRPPIHLTAILVTYTMQTCTILLIPQVSAWDCRNNQTIFTQPFTTHKEQDTTLTKLANVGMRYSLKNEDPGPFRLSSRKQPPTITFLTIPVQSSVYCSRILRATTVLQNDITSKILNSTCPKEIISVCYLKGITIRMFINHC